MSENMLFCIGEGKYEAKGIGYQKNNMVFNVKVTFEEFSKISVPKIKLPFTKWIEEKDMSNNEKKHNKNYRTLGGYLKTLSYKDSWKEIWSELNNETKDKFKSIPHFNKKLFFEITSIDVDNDQKEIEELTLAEVCKQLGKNIKIVK